MVHNGIEYGLMAAYAEGLKILRNANAGKRSLDNDAETAPMRSQEYYQYELDLPEIAEVWWRPGSSTSRRRRYSDALRRAAMPTMPAGFCPR